jgi:hypothetical protein
MIMKMTNLLSLPIGPKIPLHHLLFQSKKDVDDYLQKSGNLPIG